MSWLMPAMIASSIGSLVMLFVFAYLYSQERQEYLAVWSASWGLYFIRLVFELLAARGESQNLIFALSQLTSLWSGAFLLWGTYSFSKKKLHPAWHVVFLATSLWIALSIPFGSNFALITAPAFMIIAIANIATGVVLLRFKEIRGIAKSMAGWSFILWGVHKADYPFLRPLIWFAPWGYLIAASLAFFSSLCVILMYFRKAKEDLETSEEKYRSIYNNALEGIFQTTPEGLFLSANPALARMYGYETPEELIATVTNIDGQMYVDPADRSRLKALYEAKGSVTGFETRLYRKDGSTLWASIAARAVTDGTGRVICYEGTAQDITERKQAEEAVRKQLQFEKLLADLSRRFVSVSADRVDQEIDDALKELCSDLGFGRCAVWRQSREDPAEYVLAQVYRPPGHQPFSGPVIASDCVPWSMEKILNGETLLVPDVKGLPQEAARDQEFCNHFGITSVLAFPLSTGGGQPLGALSFSSIDNEPADWPEDFVQRLRLVAEVFANALTRKRSEEVLRESEERFRTTFEQAAVGITHTSLEGRFIRFNDRFCEIVGYNREEMLNLAYQDITHPDDLQKDLDNVRLLLEERIETYSTEKRYIRKDRSVVWGNLTATLLRGTAGEPRYFISVVEDISARKRAEEELRSSQERLHHISEATFEGIVFIEDGRIIDTNAQTAAMLGSSREDLVGRNVMDFVAPESKELVLERIRSDRSGAYEHLAQRVDGSIFPVEIRAGVTTYMGKPVRVTVIRDISERKQAEQSLKESEEKYRTIFENAVMGIFQTTPEGHYLSVNPAGARMYGYDSPDEMRELVTDVTHQIYVNPADRQRFKELAGSKEFVERFEAEHYCKDRSKIWVSMNASAVRDAGGTILYYNTTSEDITERKRLESQLRQSQKMEAIGTLAGGVAHDFNNFLTVMTGYGTLLQMQMEENDPLLLYVDQIMAASQKAANLTQSLLAFSRQQPISLNPVQLNGIVQGTEKLLRRLLTEDVLLETIYTPDDPTVMADVSQIDQILFNLVSNARDAMPKGGELVIETKLLDVDRELIQVPEFIRPGKYALLSVSDTGTGMDERTKEHIFDPFFTTKEVGKGTGLGLSTVYGIVKQHDGYITVQSEPGRGTTFHVYLPAVKTVAEEERRPEPEVRRGKETILLAEDNDSVRRLMGTVLRRYGYTVIEAVDGEDTLDKFIAGKAIDLLIVDSVMPKKNGREVYDEIRTLNPYVKVLFTSGYTRDVVLDKGIRDSEFAFISKPVSPNDLLRKVRDVLDE